MKRLIIVRHAKSSWAQHIEDRHRGLMRKGILRANVHAQMLADNLDFNPEYWATSYALRALHTATIFAEQFNRLDNLKISESLYTFNADELRTYIENIPNVLESAIIFSHNDACINLIRELTDDAIPYFKTASVAVMQFYQNRWENLSHGKLLTLIEKEELYKNGKHSTLY